MASPRASLFDVPNPPAPRLGHILVGGAVLHAGQPPRADRATVTARLSMPWQMAIGTGDASMSARFSALNSYRFLWHPPLRSSLSFIIRMGLRQPLMQRGPRQ